MTKKAVSTPAMEAFFRVARRWGLDANQQMRLLGVPPSTFLRWRKNGRGKLSVDSLERISHLLGIFKDLHVLLPDGDAADAWIKMPNAAPMFGGRSALDRMLAGQVGDLFVVRRYLDAQLHAG